jgi:uncharacterized protein YjdB
VVDDPAVLAQAEIRLLRGNGQEAVVGSELPQDLVAEVVDSTGAPVPAAPISWVFRQGRGTPSGVTASASTADARTDADGRASIRWTLGTRAGVQSASVEIVVPEPPAQASEGLLLAPRTDRGKKVGVFARAKPGSVDSIAVAPSEPTVSAGDSLQLTAVVSDEFGNLIQDASVNWSSSDGTVATTSNSGMVETFATGSATITAKSGSTTGSTSLTSTSPTVGTIDVARVIASPDTLSFSSTGETQTVTALAEDSQGQPVAGIEFGYESTNRLVVEVDSMGRASARGIGTALITVSALCCGPSDAVVVQVNDASLTITIVDQDGVALEGLDLEVGQTQSLDLELTDDSGLNLGMVAPTWSSTNPSVATVAGDGMVTALSGGTTEIRATYEGMTATATTTVASAPSAIAIVDRDGIAVDNLSLQAGQAESLEAELRDESGRSLGRVTPTWSSTDPSVATVASDGSVTALSEGSTQIRAAYDGMTDAATVTTLPDPPSDPGPGVLFHSDWSTARGSSSDALRDANKGLHWDGFTNGDNLTIVDGTPVGFPSANALEVLINPGTGNGSSIIWIGSNTTGWSPNNPWPAPGVGGSLYGRAYFRFEDTPATASDCSTHPLQEVISDQVDWWFRFRCSGSDGYTMSVSFRANSLPRDYFASSPMSTGAVYRIEWHIYHASTSPDLFNFHIRVYRVEGGGVARGGAETLVLDDSDFVNQDGVPLSRVPDLTFRSDWQDRMATLAIGINGIGGSTSGITPFLYGYWGGVMVRTDDWAGPYTSAEEAP